jgi:hypothetical protein
MVNKLYERMMESFPGWTHNIDAAFTEKEYMHGRQMNACYINAIHALKSLDLVSIHADRSAAILKATIK